MRSTVGGILNIARAFQPQGTLMLAGTALTLDSLAGGQASPPMGDAPIRLPNTIVLDRFSRAYKADFAHRVKRHGQDRPLGNALQLGYKTGAAAAGDTIVSVTTRHDLGNLLNVAFTSADRREEHERASRPVSGFALTRLSPSTAIAAGYSESSRQLQQRLDGANSISFVASPDPLGRSGFVPRGARSLAIRQALGPLSIFAAAEAGRTDRFENDPDEESPSYRSWTLSSEVHFGKAGLAVGMTDLREQSTVLGGQFDFTSEGARTRFIDAAVSYRFGKGWSAGLLYRRGWTSMPAAQLTDGGTLTSDAWAIDLGRRNSFAPGDRLAFRIGQPLRIRSGGYLMSLPMSYDYGTETAGFESRLLSLAPTGRELDLEAAYGLSLFRGQGSLNANAFLRMEPGNIEAQRNDVGAALRFSLNL
jgi:hypothetical protein